MAQPVPAEELQALTAAFAGCGGLGVDEKTLVSVLEQWKHQPEKKTLFRQTSSTLFDKHPAGFERWHGDHVIRQLKQEFSRFKNLVLLSAMHPWERDARWAHHVLHKASPPTILVEIACTRSSEELLGARRAYHALFHHSLEEDVAYHINGIHVNILVGLVSAFRYEGPRVNEEMAKSEAKIIGGVIKNSGLKNPMMNDQVIRILTTRSKLHLKATFKYYKEMYGKPLEEDIGDEPCLIEAVECLDSPATYFSKLIDNALKNGGDKVKSEALNRVIVSRADSDMMEIKEKYQSLYGVHLEEMIEKTTRGNYKDALLSLIKRKD